jgi:predicted RNA-binding Zn ribbon-like protein
VDFSHYSDLSVQMAMDLVNTRNAVSGEDRLADVEDLREFLDAYEKDWHVEDWCRDQPTQDDLAEVLELRRRLRAVFGAPDEETAAAGLNEILAEVRAVPRISLHGGSPHLHFEPTKGNPAQWLGAAAAMGLSVVLVDHGIERFGTCAAHDCVDVFIDTSRNRSRRHCSTGCTTRENVAAFRRRKKSANA